MNKFAPIHVTSGYSLLQSGLTMKKIETALKGNDYFGVGLCYKGVMYGVPSFIKTAEAIKKPCIIGVEVEIENDTL